MSMRSRSFFFSAVLVLLSVARAEAADPSSAQSPTSIAAETQLPDYRQGQWQRLSQRTDRDSLLAALLLSMSDNDASPANRADVEHRVASAFGNDPVALFVLAAGCQIQNGPCGHHEYYDALVRLAPDNAVNWLLLPNRAAPTAAQLHFAATAPMADSQLRTTMSIVQKALMDQPATAVGGIDAGDLAQALRQKVVDRIPLPEFGATVRLCKAPPDVSRDDCVRLGRKLIDDNSGAILARMVGSAMLQRLVKGTPEDVAAKELRRNYVWLSEQLPEFIDAPVHDDIVHYGEWDAWLRAADRAHVSRTPPPTWLPKNPQSLLLSEERTSAK
jgi:hypothetical protein